VSTVETRRSPPPWALVAGFGVLVVGLLVWAKWQPYWVKVPAVAESGSLGKSILAGTPSGVSVRAGLAFAGTYFLAIWPALVAGLVIAAAVATVLPADWLARVFGRDGAGGAVRGGALALPSMMCSCCAAPIAVGLRQRSASVVSSLTYWLANPALNPVVLAFCAFVLPWPWTVLRAGAGLVVVVGAVLIARRSTVRTVDEAVPVPEPTADDRPLATRFLIALGRLSVRLLPEYLVLVVVLGAFRGVLFPVSSGLMSGTTLLLVVGVVLLAVAGTLLPVPTGAEVAVIAALLAAGIAAPLAAALLVTLPALSLPSLLMVRRAFPRRTLVSVTALVAGVGVLCAAVAGAF
jgi:uncharacterized membrane protein YraQ (UPF0718 family)